MRRRQLLYELATDRWREIAPLRRPRGAAAAVMLDGRLHLIGGASEPASERASVGWHEVYDPQADAWTQRKPLPGARDHVGCVAHAGLIHVVGGRFNTFEYNTDLHHVYLPARDTWELRAPLPTARSGHGLVVLRGRFYAMGGEGGILAGGVPRQATVFGQMESYDPAADSWQRHAELTRPLGPRHPRRSRLNDRSETRPSPARPRSWRSRDRRSSATGSRPAGARHGRTR